MTKKRSKEPPKMHPLFSLLQGRRFSSWVYAWKNTPSGPVTWVNRTSEPREDGSVWVVSVFEKAPGGPVFLRIPLLEDRLVSSLGEGKTQGDLSLFGFGATLDP